MTDVPKTLTQFRKHGRLSKIWFGIRLGAIERARAGKVDADVEAALRNYHQLSRTYFYALVATVPLTLVNILLLKRSFNLESSWAALALMVGQVGAIFSLSRSNETRAYLGEVRLVLHEVATRTALAGAAEYRRDVERSETEEALGLAARQLLDYLRESRLFPLEVDAFSVWARDDVQGVWRIVAARGPSSETVDSFRQPILEQETPGAGVVANLAVTADENHLYYQGTSEGPPKDWFKPDPSQRRKTETLAVFLLPDEDGVPIGAFALTSGRKDALGAGTGIFSERLSLIVDQCSLTLRPVARRAHSLWSQSHP